MNTIGFLGPRGTFTEGAARVYVAALRNETGGGAQSPPGTPEPTLKAYNDIPGLLMAVERGTVAKAIVPVENSIEGTINVTVDTLVHDVDLTIIAEVVLPIRHHLLVRSGTVHDAIRTVVSHPQALAQCRRWLDTNLPGVTVEAALSTAAAAAKAGGEAAPGVGAIGNALCAKLYGLTIIASDIQDESTNATRFFVLRRVGQAVEHGRGAVPTDGYKTSIAFAFAADGPGNLYGALGEFARHGVNLTKLESRPARQALGQYIFFVDLEGHAQHPPVAAALDALERECTFVKLLGSYERIVDPPVGL